MSFRTYLPKRGDLIHINFSPSSGHELADRHYAIVLSQDDYNRTSRMAIVCGVTSRVHGWPFEVLLPPGLLPPKRGVGDVQSVIVADVVRQIDYRERECSFVNKAPDEIVEEVINKLLAVIEGK
ncbi:MAG: type II toxin-antitoxin system PemK/MazF family toxin [Phycisphaerae bacterium]|nr:type II toxin-antitoxin system PemK/MazF family toxin [Phycisphaerae bacterium]